MRKKNRRLGILNMFQTWPREPPKESKEFYIMAKILVVDDRRSCQGITFNLKNEGYQVETGYEARRRWSWG